MLEKLRKVLKNIGGRGKQPRPLETWLRSSVRGWRPSSILSLDDERYHANDRLIELSLRVIRTAFSTDLHELSDRFSDEHGEFLHHYPGEHYRLLAGLVKEWNHDCSSK
jgi:hypothetical protein